MVWQVVEELTAESVAVLVLRPGGLPAKVVKRSGCLLPLASSEEYFFYKFAVVA